MAGDTYGVELFGQWEITKRWRLRGYYAFLMIRLQPGPTAVPGSDLAQGESPQNQVYLSSSWDLGRNVDFDLIARYVESLPALQVPGYIEMDIRFAWRPRKHLELAVVGQNLLQDEHYEFTGTQFVADQPTAVPRSVYGKVTWTW
jgi:iron complex outermembrane receptor protein